MSSTDARYIHEHVMWLVDLVCHLSRHMSALCPAIRASVRAPD